MLGCSESKFEPVPTDNVPPSALSITGVESIPGGAKIYFTPPNETDISYVRGEYMFKGEKRVVRSSIYNNYVIVEGLGSTDPIEITLYMVDHSENTSAPVVRSFTPQTPPIYSVLSSISVLPDFGGITALWDNPTMTEIRFSFMVEDSLGVLQDHEMTFSNAEAGKFSLRGFDTTERKWGIYLRDKWGNMSDTLVAMATPFYEEKLDKKKFFEVGLPGDNTTVRTGRPLANIWDDNIDVIWHTDPGMGDSTPPQKFTICFGNDVEAKLSRFVMYPRRESYYYGQHNPRYFQVYATTELKYDKTNQDYWRSDDWKADWEFLGDYEVVKPSGLSGSQYNELDKAVWDAGFNFEVPLESNKIKYVRFVVIATWANSAALHINEMTFYGDDFIDN
jgi:hypothetical protein